MDKHVSSIRKEPICWNPFWVTPRFEQQVHQAMQNMHLEPESGTLRNYAQVRGRCIGTLRPTKRLRCKTRP